MISLAITSAASDRMLVSLDDVKAALDVAGTDRDAAITALSLRVSDAIAQHCRVAAGGLVPPTLKRETLTQTFRQDRATDMLLLSRRFVHAISSVVEDGTTLSASDYELDAGSGQLTRLDGDDVGIWACGKIVVVYLAGFDSVPEDLQLACLTTIREQWSALDRDPLLRAETVDGVGRLDFWVGGLTKLGAGPFSFGVGEMLRSYRCAGLA